MEGVRDLEEWDSWKGNEGLGFSEKVVYMVKQKGDGGGKVAFLESLGLSLSSAMYLAHYVSSESLPKLLDKVQNNSLFSSFTLCLNCRTNITDTVVERSIGSASKSLGGG